MKILIKALKIFAVIWMLLAGVFILIGMIGVYSKTGFAGVRELVMPWNLANYFMMFLTCSPGLIAYMVSEQLEDKYTD